MPKTFINAYGEVLTKEDLIKEIQALLNQFQESQTTILDPHIMESLDIESLNSIRDNLLEKCGNEIQNNKEWLHSLKDND